MAIVYECIRELKRPIVDGWDVIMEGELFKHLHDDTYKSIGLGNFNFTKEFSNDEINGYFRRLN